MSPSVRSASRRSSLHVETTLERRRMVVEAAAMGRVEAADARAFTLLAPVLSAGHMHRLWRRVHARMSAPQRSANWLAADVGGDIGRADIAAHGCAKKAQFQVGFEIFKPGLAQAIARCAVAYDADCVTERRLRRRQIPHMAEKASDRSAQTMQNAAARRYAVAAKRSNDVRGSARRHRSCRRAG